MKRLVAIMLALFMLMTAVLLVACEDEKKPDSSTPGSSSSSSDPTSNDPGQSTDPSSSSDEPVNSGDSTTSSENPVQTPEPSTSGGGTTPDLGDGLSKPAGYLDVDFGGHTFTFVTTSDWADEVGRWCTEKEIAVETRSGGTIIDTAVYDRNHVMKTLYNCEIKAVEGSTGTLIGNDVNSGTNTYDFGALQGGYYTANTNGYYVNVYDLDLDFNLPGWNKTFFAQTTVRDSNGVNKLYTVDATFNLSTMKATWVLYCNLDLYNQNFSESIFDIVDKGEWTMDKMIEMITAVAKDNGDSVWTIGEDTYGFMTSTHNAPAFITSMGIRLVNVDDNFNYTTSTDVILANNAVEAISKAGQLYALEGVNVGSYTAAAEQLQAGKTLFIGEVMDVLERISDTEDLNVTIIPEPLYSSETQDDYKVYVNGKGSLYAISKNACGGDKEMVSDFLNMFVFHSDKLVYPVFLKTYGSVYCQNERSMDMLTHIVEGRTYDFGYYRGDSYGQMGDFMHSNKNSLSRAANKFNTTLQEKINDVVSNMTKSD